MAESPVPVTVTRRRSDLDWLRVLGVLLLVPFHSALVFNLDPNSIVYAKDVVSSPFLVGMAGFIHRWHMPLLFAIAGAASWFALGRRSASRYLNERVGRLVVPAVFGMLVLIPLMINLRRLFLPDPPSLMQIYGRYFTVNLADLTGYAGTWTPGHLWFILYLALFSLLGLPLFMLLRRPAGQRVLSKFAGCHGGIYLFAIPLALLAAVNLLGDKNPLYYFAVFCLGYLLLASPRFGAALDRYLWLSLGLAVAATLGSCSAVQMGRVPWSAAWIAVELAYQVSRWVWVLAILAAGQRWLNRDSALLRYASEAAYPFYILHLPIDTLVTLAVIRLRSGIEIKYLLIVGLTSLLSLAIYDLVVKQFDVLRFCFGMKPRAAQSRREAAARQPSG